MIVIKCPALQGTNEIDAYTCKAYPDAFASNRKIEWFPRNCVNGKNVSNCHHIEAWKEHERIL